MSEHLPNVEQMEAEELDIRPRIVITAEKLFSFVKPGQTIILTKAQLEAVMTIMTTIRDSEAN